MVQFDILSVRIEFRFQTWSLQSIALCMIAPVRKITSQFHVFFNWEKKSALIKWICLFQNQIHIIIEHGKLNLQSLKKLLSMQFI